MSLFSFVVAVDEEETNLTTWSSQSTKLLISLPKENDSLFTKGKVRKNVAWQRVAAQFNATSSVKVNGEQCSNKCKKLEKFKKTKEHNNKTGNNRKECDFQDELSEFFGDNPKIIPLATVASLPADGNSTDEDGEDLQAESSSDPALSKPKKKKKRRSKSLALEMIDFLVEFKEEKRKEEEKKVAIIERMHADKMGIMT